MANELQFRSTVVAIEKEITQNTLVEPTAATSFIPILGNFEVTPAFDVIETEEVLNSIGTPKATLGFENPSASVSLYLKGSSVQAQPPAWGALLESLMGARSVSAAEYDVIAGSTTTVLNLGVGEAATFERGEAVMVKDSSMTNGYQIRNILSVDTILDKLTLSQALPSAPAALINLGRAILYKPANSGHPSLSLWDYHSNGGATQVVSGARAVSMAASITAGGAIQADFSLEGIEFFFDPMIVKSTNKWFDVNEGGPEINVSLAEKTYKDPYDLAAAIQTALDNACAATILCTYSDITRKYTITSNGATFQILWKTGVHGSDNTDTHIGSLIGFADAADDTLALSYVSDNAIVFTAPFTPTFDATDINVAKDNQVLLGGQTDITCFRASTLTVNIGHDHTKVDDICATSGRSGSLFTKRTVTVDVVSYLELGQSEEFKKFRNNDQVAFTFNYGKKSGGSWTPGTAGNIHMPTATISSFKLGNNNGLVTLEMQLKGFVASGLDEIYINYL
jgi:hypothetical protein